MPFFTISLVLLSDVQFLPISGLCGTNMKTKMDKSICSWWDGPCLFDVLDHIEVPLCDHKGSVRFEGCAHASYTFIIVCAMC
jgi:translation elongation factor EF-1alpha